MNLNKIKQQQNIYLNSGLPSEGYPMAAWPSIEHVRPDNNKVISVQLKKNK